MFRNFILFLFLIFILNTNNGYSQPNINESFTNIVLHKKPKDLPIFELKNKNGKLIVFNDFSAKLTLINFWATWCAPCKKELPKLEFLSNQFSIKDLQIILVNIEEKKYEDIQKFFNELKIKNLKSFFDNKLKLTKQLSLRGIPITLIVNSSGKEIARIIGDLDFTDKRFITWIKNY